MHRFPHGIRRAFLRPVWAPFRRCLPLLALLQSCPEDGDDDELLPNKAQHEGVPLPAKEDLQKEGALLPVTSGEDEGVSTPTSEANKDLRALCVGQDEEQNGNLLPLNGEDGNQPANADLANAEANNLHQEIEDGRSLQEEGVLLPTTHAEPMLLPTQFQGALQFQPIHVFDPGGILHLHEPHSGVEMVSQTGDVQDKPQEQSADVAVP
ncbi:hypothetical protein L7F22_042745 [Adiantum nelumboides]|nr:hypothetical protein [Adiantum nelumboides]